MRTIVHHAKRKYGVQSPEQFILASACVFILVLAVSAYCEADVRSLHFFQVWIRLPWSHHSQQDIASWPEPLTP